MIKVIKRSAVPTSLPASSTMIYILALDYWNASQLVWGICLAVIFLIWVVKIILICKEQQVDIFNAPSKDNSFKKSKFQEKLDEKERRNEN